AGPMADQLMCQRPADTDEDEVPDCMFEHRAMPDLENVIKIRLVAAGPRSRKAHVTKSPCNFRQVLPRDFGISLPADTMIREKPINFLFLNHLPSYQVHG